MSSLRLKLENAKEYYEEKLAAGRTDPIAKLLLSTLKREIEILEKKVCKYEGRQKDLERGCTARVIKYVREALYRLWNIANPRDNSLSRVSTGTTSQEPGVTS